MANYIIIGSSSNEYGCRPFTDQKIFSSLKDAKKELSRYYKTDKNSFDDCERIFFDKKPTEYCISNADKSFECVALRIVKLK